VAGGLSAARAAVPCVRMSSEGTGMKSAAEATGCADGALNSKLWESFAVSSHECICSQ
jgi:hypothetical protein